MTISTHENSQQLSRTRVKEFIMVRLYSRAGVSLAVSLCCYAFAKEESRSRSNRERKRRTLVRKEGRRLLGPRSLFFSLWKCCSLTHWGKRRAKMMMFRSAPVSRREGGTRTERADLDETRNVFARERRSFAGGGVVWVVVDSAR